MTIAEWLETAKVDRLDAELIVLEGVGRSGIDRSFLVAHGELELTRGQLEWMNSASRRRMAGEPLAYLLGRKEFYGRELEVNSDVLIPRPETEDLIELVKEAAAKVEGCVLGGGDLAYSRVKGRLSGDADVAVPGAEIGGDYSGLGILDVGTGSGCIAITLALELPGSKVTGVDISAAALAVARRNNEGLGAGVEFAKSDLLLGVDLEKVDILVANLPYVDREWDWINERALGFEPEGALYAEEKGLADYRRLFEQLDDFGKNWAKMRKGGELKADAMKAGDMGANAKTDASLPRFLVFEADPCQHEELARLAAEFGWQSEKTRGFGVVFSR